MNRKNILISSFLLIVFTSNASAEEIIDNGHFQQCLNELLYAKEFKTIKKSTFDKYRPTEPDSSVIRSLNYQPEFKKEVWDYLAILVDKQRVEDGIDKSLELQHELQEIKDKYKVKPEDVLAVWGVESDYGQKLGKKNLFKSLATLSCFDRRQKYFRQEFANALKIVQNGDIAAKDMNGSWAGAFGQTQFMPSTFLRLAQDFDGDGKKDLVNSQTDALASTANFLQDAGYDFNDTWGYEINLPADIKAKSDRKNKKPISHWKDMGVTLVNGDSLPNSPKKLALFMPSGHQGPAFLVGKNFDVFYSYNASENYALAIAHLSDLIANQKLEVNFVTPWPTTDVGIDRAQSIEIQKALANIGYDVGTIDGVIGDQTRKAIQQYQNQYGIEATGRAGLNLYNHLSARGFLLDKTFVSYNNPQLNQQFMDTDIDHKSSLNLTTETIDNKNSSKTDDTRWLFGILMMAFVVLLLIFSLKKVVNYKK